MHLLPQTRRALLGRALAGALAAFAYWPGGSPTGAVSHVLLHQGGLGYGLLASPLAEWRITRGIPVFLGLSCVACQELGAKFLLDVRCCPRTRLRRIVTLVSLVAVMWMVFDMLLTIHPRIFLIVEKQASPFLAF